MSLFSADAAAAREAHEYYFGDTIVLMSPANAASSPIKATIHSEEVRQRKTNLGIEDVVTRMVVARKALLPSNLSPAWTVSIDSTVYSIERTTKMGTQRTALHLMRSPTQEISRPGYRGNRQ